MRVLLSNKALDMQFAHVCFTRMPKAELILRHLLRTQSDESFLITFEFCSNPLVLLCMQMSLCNLCTLRSTRGWPKLTQATFTLERRGSHDVFLQELRLLIEMCRKQAGNPSAHVHVAISHFSHLLENGGVFMETLWNKSRLHVGHATCCKHCSWHARPAGGGVFGVTQ